ncbi:DUF4202 domain-containing protein [Aquihabitans sp. G128]|uniref:DUF4202 domain-containing protein n=1 Tax=Aquihabitans sp. G128 TaxID=2849779 RepID=UPI001C23A052|nr:DUF4202 domain-containing protein [Aquihabitans sp. G128]QXC61595.1 DUF4202 domain-containing protein [Aquihabitans sp. G128]
MATEPAEPGGDRLARGLAAIDAANAEDPNQLVVDGTSRPKELVHAERMSHWLAVLAPDATEAQQLAARAHHLRRWVSPRSDYPDGRAAYLRWRADHKRREAAEVGELLEGVGYDAATIERVQAIVAKERLRSDPDVQTQEDALCLVFLELQYDDVAAQLGDEHTIQVLQRTAKKMSPAGLAATGAIAFSEHGAALLARALAPAEDPPPR